MEVNNKVSTTISLEAIGFIVWIVFFILKMTNNWDVSWFWVWFPLWIPWAVDGVILALIALYCIFLK